MKTIMNRSVRVILYALLCKGTNAQLKQSKYEWGASLNTFIYQGDLAHARYGSWKTPGFGISLSGSRVLSSSFALRTQLAFGQIKGDDSKYSTPEWKRQRNFKFKSPVFEISEAIVWNLRGANYTDNKSSGISPYFFTGVGYSLLHINRDWSNFNAEFFPPEYYIHAGLAADAVHRLPRGILVIPAGAGIRYLLSGNFLLNAEASYRFTFSDYLDGFSQAANPTKKDSYYSISVGVIYKPGGFFKWWRCPPKP